MAYELFDLLLFGSGSREFLLAPEFIAQGQEFIPGLHMHCLFTRQAARLYALGRHPVERPAPDRAVDQPAYECFHLVGVSISAQSMIRLPALSGD